MNSNVCFNARIVSNVSSSISPRISDQRFAMHSHSLHTDNNWNNWFHFQYDRLWPVNMTGKTKSWLVNSPISPDIVRWPAVISSPAFPCGLRAKNEERESKTARKLAQVKELLFHFSRGQNRKSRSTVFLCSETKRKRLLGRLTRALYLCFKVPNLQDRSLLPLCCYLPDASRISRPC